MVWLFQIFYNGLHQGGKQSAAAFRDLVSKEETNAMTENNLAKTDPKHPVSAYLRSRITPSGLRRIQNKKTVRENDVVLIPQAINLISSFDFDIMSATDEDKKTLYEDLDALLQRGSVRSKSRTGGGD